MSSSARWTLTVSRRTDDSLRQFLASQGHGQRGALSRFVEEAVQAHILELACKHAQEQNANVAEDEITAAIDEAVEWARRA